MAADPQLSLSSPHPTRAGAGGSVVLPKPTCTAEEMACKKKKKGKNRLWKVGCGGSQLGVVLRPVLPGDTGQCLKTFSVLTPGCYWHLGGGGQGCH